MKLNTPSENSIAQSYENVLRQTRRLDKPQERRLKWHKEELTTRGMLPQMLNDITIFGSPQKPHPFDAKMREKAIEYGEVQIRSEPFITTRELYPRLEGFISGYVWREIDLFAERLKAGEIVIRKRVHA